MRKKLWRKWYWYLQVVCKWEPMWHSVRYKMVWWHIDEQLTASRVFDEVLGLKNSNEIKLGVSKVWLHSKSFPVQFTRTYMMIGNPLDMKNVHCIVSFVLKTKELGVGVIVVIMHRSEKIYVVHCDEWWKLSCSCTTLPGMITSAVWKSGFRTATVHMPEFERNSSFDRSVTEKSLILNEDTVIHNL